MTWQIKKAEYGDIIRVKVKFYHHYGIFADENCVIQFGLPDNTNMNPDDIEVLETDIQTFANGETVEVAKLDRAERKSARRPDETVEMAKSRLGEKGYNILHNNCEHFVNDCAFGEKRSSFLENVRSSIRGKING